MKGRIKMYNASRGFGFIAGEDARDRFFHVSNVKSAALPMQGAIVEFESEQTERGLVAKNILVQEEKHYPVFVQFGDTRIKLANIKSYGVSIHRTYFEKIYEKVGELTGDETGFIGFLKSLVDWDEIEFQWQYKGRSFEVSEVQAAQILRGQSKRAVYVKKGERYKLMDNTDGSHTYERYHRADKDGIYCLERNTEKTDLIIKDRQYLYITTYQNDNYRFYEDEVGFDINEKVRELDIAFGAGS
jgi:CspA family cold shock protein